MYVSVGGGGGRERVRKKKSRSITHSNEDKKDEKIHSQYCYCHNSSCWNIFKIVSY